LSGKFDFDNQRAEGRAHEAGKALYLSAASLIDLAFANAVVCGRPRIGSPRQALGDDQVAGDTV
jgi:hypothetical protein